MEGGREGGMVFQREGVEGRKGGSEGGYYKGSEEWEGGREGGREREGIITKGGMDVWMDEDRGGRYYKGSGEASRQAGLPGRQAGRQGITNGGREGGREGGRGEGEGGREGGRENITNERIETVI